MATALVKSGDAPFFSFANCQRWDIIINIFLKQGVYPFWILIEKKTPEKGVQAAERNRTADLRLTKATLYRLSHREFDS